MRVIAERSSARGQGDCYAVLGIIHSLWKPMPGRFKDYRGHAEAEPLPVVAHDRDQAGGESRSRSRCARADARDGRARHRRAGSTRRARRDPQAEAERLAWLKQLRDWQQEETDAGEFMRTFRADHLADEVRVHAEGGQSLPTGSTIDFAYAVHTDVGHRTVGAKVNARIVLSTISSRAATSSRS